MVESLLDTNYIATFYCILHKDVNIALYAKFIISSLGSPNNVMHSPSNHNYDSYVTIANYVTYLVTLKQTHTSSRKSLILIIIIKVTLHTLVLHCASIPVGMSYDHVPRGRGYNITGKGKLPIFLIRSLKWLIAWFLVVVVSKQLPLQGSTHNVTIMLSVSPYNISDLSGDV